MCKRWQSTIYGGTERVLYSTQVHIHRYVYRYVVTYTEKERRGSKTRVDVCTHAMRGQEYEYMMQAGVAL